MTKLLEQAAYEVDQEAWIVNNFILFALLH